MRALFCTVLLFSAAVSHAAPRIAIVDVDGPSSMIGLASQMTQQVVKAAQAQQLSIITPREVRSRLDDKIFAELQKCNGRPSCVAQFLTGIGADRAVVGSITRDTESYLVKLFYIDLKDFNVIADIDRSILIASRRLQSDIEAAIPGMLRGEKEARGKITLTSNAPKATVFLNGEPAGVTPLELELKPGKYKVRIEKKAYTSVDRFIAVEANQSTQEDVRLTRIVGQQTEEEALPALQAANAAPPETPGTPISARTWLAGGGTLVLAGLGGMFGAFSSAAEKRLRTGYDSDTQRYQGTRVEAIQAVNDARLANALFIAAGAGAAVTGLFIYWDVTDAPAPKVSAAVTPEGAAVTLGGSF
ncbi:MAG: PEGA domain-containing protein [Myxococcaceae bacterium]|nr:PEGA domain-containing protein [Myxococcaceae bacterium]